MFQHHQIIKYVDFTGGLDTNKHQTTWITWQGFFPPDNNPLKSTFAITFAPKKSFNHFHGMSLDSPFETRQPAMVSPEITIDISILSIYAKPHPFTPCWIPTVPPLVPQDSGIRSTTPKAKVSFGLMRINLSDRKKAKWVFPKIVVPPNHPF